MKYIIRNKLTNSYVCYSENRPASDCWSTLKKCANAYGTYHEARAEAHYIAKTSGIDFNDLVIETTEIFHAKRYTLFAFNKDDNSDKVFAFSKDYALLPSVIKRADKEANNYLVIIWDNKTLSELR